MTKGASTAWTAWTLAAVYYFYQYALRAAPAVMMPQISAAFGLSAAGVASLAGIFYYGYSTFSLVAGAAMDRMGAKAVIPAGALITGVGALLFGLDGLPAANLGRFLQGAGGVFALVGAIYIASKNFPASQAATLIGATQMFGMAGGSAGQFLVGPLIAQGLSWKSFWIVSGVAGILIAFALFCLLPGENVTTRPSGGTKSMIAAMGSIFRNPQSILCGLIGGLLFIPTTILDMTWGVRFLQEGHGFDYGEAVMRSAMVPLGWIVGCPMLGMLSDRLGRRRPVIIAGASVLFLCLLWILYGQASAIPPYIVGLVAGLASGAAMLPYTVIKEANPPELSGTATGVVSFLIFTFSALLGPVFARAFEMVSGGQQIGLEHYQLAFRPMLYGVGAAILLTLLLKETGSAVRVPLGRMRLA
jgi:MFS family permease